MPTIAPALFFLGGRGEKRDGLGARQGRASLGGPVLPYERPNCRTVEGLRCQIPACRFRTSCSAASEPRCLGLPAYLTGLRRGRLAVMLWTDVDWDGGAVWIRRGESRNKRGTKVPLEGELRDIIARRWAPRGYRTADGETAVSPSSFHRDRQPIGDFRKAWASACKAAGVAGRLFHDMRRSVLRTMIRAGVPEAVAMRIGGHKTRAAFGRYNIASKPDIREAVGRTQAYLETLPAAAPNDQPRALSPTVYGQSTDSKNKKGSGLCRKPSNPLGCGGRI